MIKTKHALVERIGSIFNPQVEGVDYRVRFEYDEGSYFEVFLESDGSLAVRASGRHSDLLATHHHVANDIRIVARRWDDEHRRLVDFVREES